MDESLDVRGGSTRQREHPAHRDTDALEQILGRAGDLGEHQAALAVESHDVGERAADVNADLHGCDSTAPKGRMTPVTWIERLQKRGLA